MAVEPLSYPDEIWKPVIDDRYADALEASDYGRVRRLPRVITNGGAPGLRRPYTARRGLRLAAVFWRDPYFYVSVHYAGGGKKMMGVPVHILVCAAFHGPRPSPDHLVAHWDGIDENITPGNLRWALPIDNSADKYRHGTQPLGERVHSAILTEKQVREIRASHSGRYGENVRLAKLYGVAPPTIGGIVRRTAWTHVT